MTTPLFNNFVLSKDTTQPIFYNRNDDGAIVVVRFVNRGTEKARIVVAVTSTTSLPTNLGEYIDFGTVIQPGQTYEITGLVVPSNFYLVVQSTKNNLSVLCSGFATGTAGPDVSISTASPASIVGSGLVYNYDAAHVLGLDNSPSAILPDIEGNVPLTGVNLPAYNSGNGSYSFNGTNQWFTSTEAILPEADGLMADVGNTWSVEAWYRFPVTPSGTRTGNQAWTVVGKGGGIGGAETFTLFVGSATDTFYHPGVPYFNYIGVRGLKTQIAPGSVNDNTWRQAVITWDGTAGSVYHNGSLVSALNVGGAAQQFGTWTIGANGGAASTFAFEGSIGPVRVYNRALTAGEVTINWNYTRARFGL